MAATRSHPPTLLTLLERALREDCGVVPGDRILVAVSGGPDSMALLHGIALLRERLDVEVAAHGVDHGLRAEAKGELDLVAALCEELEVSFQRSQVQVSGGGNLMERAREARYAALWRAVQDQNATWLATAHHAEDRAETVLLRLLRGAGPTGLAVLPAVHGQLIRPLWSTGRAAIDAHVARHGIQCAQDPSNQDPRFLRVRVRNELLPLMEELSPGIVGHLNALATQLQPLSRSDPLPSATREQLQLKRAHLEAVARARRLRQSARVAIGGGRELVVAAGSGAVSLHTPGAQRPISLDGPLDTGKK